MKFEIVDKPLDKISSDGVIVFVFNKKDGLVPTKSFIDLDTALEGMLSDAAQTDKFTGKQKSVMAVYTSKKILASKVFVIGLGEKAEVTANDVRRAVVSLTKQTRKKMNSFVISLLDAGELSINPEMQAFVLAEGFLLGNYSFDQYKEKSKGEKELEIVMFAEKKVDVQKHIKKGVVRAEYYTQATYLARDLVNEQSAVMTPTKLAEIAKGIAQKNPEVTCRVIDKKEAEELGMHAFLGIARASDTPPKFIHLEYKPEKSTNKRKLAIIGKGITFDSGGISLKPADFMTTMKCDMAGGAAVLGVFSVISQIKPDFPVMGLIAATPNLISGSSLVPGDVVRAMNGKTIEVLNTDAEGRVTMADALAYALKHDATELIDLATLTGACMVALGNDIAGLFSNNADIADRVRKAAFESGEKVWELPLPKEYKDLNKSDVADIANIPSTRYGGAIAAGLFLQEFVDNKPWVHLDIAGPAFSERESEFGPKGGTGYGVRMLLNLISQ